MSARTGCCAGATVYKVDSSPDLVWARDYFKGSAARDVPAFLSFEQLSADQDLEGNVYQAGPGNYPALVTNGANPQSPALYNVVSWNSAGNLRWKWSEAPLGTVSGGVRSAPHRWARLRCSANGQILLGSTAATGAGPAAAIDADANLIWQAASLSVLLDGGAATSLWSGLGGPFGDPFLIAPKLVNNLTGVGTAMLIPAVSGSSALPPKVATLDHDDTWYGWRQFTIGPGINPPVMCKVSAAGAIVWHFDPTTIFVNLLADPTDAPILMRADGNALIVGSMSRTVALNKSTGALIWQVATPAIAAAWWPSGGGVYLPPRPYAGAQDFIPTSNWKSILDTHARTVLREWIGGAAALGQANMDDCSLAADGTSIWSGASRAQPANQLIAAAQCKWHVVNISGTLTWVKVFDDCHLCGRSACAAPVDTPQTGQVRFTACGP